MPILTLGLKEFPGRKGKAILVQCGKLLTCNNLAMC